jgi:putative membrane protein
MGGFVIRAVISALGLWIASLVVPGLSFTGHPIAGVSGHWVTLIETAVLLGLANAVVRPILVILTFPITVLTLGLFLLIINAGMIELVAHFLHGFHVRDFKTAIFTAIVTGVISWIGHGLTDDSRSSQVRR